MFGAISTFIGFLFSIFMSGFNGYKAWKGSDHKGPEWGKNQVIVSAVWLFIAVVLAVVFFICINSKGEKVDPSVDKVDPSVDSATESPTVSETRIIGTNGVYVYKQSYQGATYSGYVNDQREPDGTGTMYYSDGKVYTGNWVDGIQDGQGKMIYTNSDTYDGEWHNGKRNGIGTYTWKDGKSYVGGYVDDARNGEGTFFGWVDLTNGYSGTYYGESKNDQFDGAGFFQFDNGDQFDGIYKDNLYWTGVYTRKDGTTFHVVNGKAE